MAERFGVDTRSLYNWAHGHRNMLGMAKTVLKMLIAEYGMDEAVWKRWLGKE